MPHCKLFHFAAAVTTLSVLLYIFHALINNEYDISTIVIMLAEVEGLFTSHVTVEKMLQTSWQKNHTVENTQRSPTHHIQVAKFA